MQSLFTPAAHLLWDAIPLHFQERVLQNVWCPHCGDAHPAPTRASHWIYWLFPFWAI